MIERSLPQASIARAVNRYVSLALLAGLGVGWVVWSNGLARGAETPVPRRSRPSIYHPPRALRYVPETDDVVRQTSVFNGEEPDPGGALGYYGNRLTQFRFIGPPGQGGIYDAFEQERRERPLDPAKYRYRWRY